MEKYTTANESIKIKNCYNSIVKQISKVNKNFKYSEVQKGKDKKYFGSSIYWLTNAKVVLKADNLEEPRITIEFHIEVKNSKRVTSKSLNEFMKKFKCPYAYRVSMKNFGYENNIKSISLYAVGCIKK